MPQPAVHSPVLGPARVSAHEMADYIDSVLVSRHPDLDSVALRLSTNLKRTLTLLGHRESEAVHQHIDCPLAGFRVLAMLSIFGEMYTRDICKLSGVSRQAQAGVLKTLEKRGLVERDRSTGCDRRQYRVGITSEGARLIEPALQMQNHVHSRFFDVLEPEEQRQLSCLLTKVVAGQRHSVAGF